MTMSDCTEPNRAKCPRLCHDFCNKAETEKANRHCLASPGFRNNYGYHQMYIDRRGEERIMSYSTETLSFT